MNRIAYPFDRARDKSIAGGSGRPFEIFEDWRRCPAPVNVPRLMFNDASLYFWRQKVKTMLSDAYRRETDLLSKTIFVATLLLTASQALAASDGPFADLSGYWTGGGSITMSNGTSERIRCKAVYAVNGSGKSLNQSIRCASDSYRLEITGNVTAQGGTLSGTWGEATRHASGNITGRASSAEIQARIDGVGFSAGLQVRFHGDRQSVSIKPTQGTDVSDVSITLRKG